MTATVLLTGGAGYIGSHTYIALSEAGFTPVILDNFSNASTDVPDRLQQITGQPIICARCDMLDKGALDRVFAQYGFDAVVHFAAKKAVGESVARPLSYIENNCVGLINLLGAMENHHVGTLVFSSSATVYGTPKTLPIAEDAPLGFTNPYGYTKFAGEQILTQIGAVHPDWAIGILRYFNPAGAHASGLIADSPRNPDGTRRIPENLVPFIADVACGARAHLRIFGDDYDTPDGTGVRDYIHIEDLAAGHVRSLQTLLARRKSHTVNLGTGRGYSVREVLSAYSDACGRDLPYELAPRRNGDVASCYADVRLARTTLGFEAKHDIGAMCASSWNAVRMRNS
jgi:UDP-glucose 4-epimerase